MGRTMKTEQELATETATQEKLDQIIDMLAFIINQDGHKELAELYVDRHQIIKDFLRGETK